MMLCMIVGGKNLIFRDVFDSSAVRDPAEID